MKRLAAVAAAVCAITVCAHAIGLQHGLFRSQSTQGAAWQGTATITQETYNITVYPDYLDVELEWVMQAGGGTPPSEHADALEIVGNINLVDKSVVVGMITWWNGMVLKGKLKTQETAREEYEEVVDRDSDRPPPPRDPVLLEWIRDDNYDISIFPVSYGGTRRVRFRYLIPAFCGNGVNRIEYPHAFTAGATVRIRKGDGVQSYRVETMEPDNVLYGNSDFLPLDPSAYEFQAYGGDRQGRITAIVPVLKDQSAGSRFYLGGFTTPQFSGWSLHVTTMAGEELLRELPLRRDFVILWRWNHPQVLEKYARQIVEQSGLLQEFLGRLNAARERVALVIDREGGERTTFRLDTPGGPEYARMIAYLEELAARTVVDPPLRDTPRTGDIPFDVQAAVEEFRAALAAAMELFDHSSGAMRHLLVLCAGPRLVNAVAADPDVARDSTVDISLFTSYLRSGGSSAADLGSVSDGSYWPGVDIKRFVANHRAALSVTATVSNGLDTHTIQVTGGAATSQYCYTTGESQMYLYSDQPVRRQVRWRVMQNGTLLADHAEKPIVVPMTDGMQYARVIGASPYLTPLARRMPSSMAAALGFVDEKYSLVALEQDALPAAEAARYEHEGVPLLTEGDIYAAADERYDVPVAEWLVANPPEKLSSRMCDYSIHVRAGGDTWAFAVPNAMTVDMVALDMNVVVGAEPGRTAMPMAPAVYAENADAYIDYESALAAAPAPARNASAPAPSALCRITRGALVLNLAAYAPEQRRAMTLTLCDLTGRSVARISGGRLAASERLSLSSRDLGLSSGTYTLRLTGPGIAYSRQVTLYAGR